MNKDVILVVEDDPLQRRLIKENLERERYTVIDAATGQAAIEEMGRLPAEVAVIDYKLGGETGLDVMRALQRDYPSVAVIMVTAFAGIETAVAAVKAGAYDYLVKPLDFKKLLLVIDRARERQGLRQEVRILRETLEDKFRSRNFVYASSGMEEVSRLITRAAGSDATVLITGETGTGRSWSPGRSISPPNGAGGPF